MNLFNAQVLSIERGEMIVGADREYQTISDGLSKNLMRDIARELIRGAGGGAVSLPDQSEGQRPVREPRAPREPQAPREPRERKEGDNIENDPKLNTIGVSFGTPSFFSFQPRLIGTIHGTIAPTRYSFFEIGMDMGFSSGVGVDDYEIYISSYTSLYPFVHYAFFLPFPRKGGWYIGGGGGWMISFIDFSDNYEGYIASTVDNSFIIDVVTGFNLFNVLDISYTLRTNFYGVLHKVSLGYTYRFKGSNKGGQ